MVSLSLYDIEQELKKRHPYAYEWGRKQNDIWDGYTNFIYKTPFWDEVVEVMKITIEAYNLDKKELFQYAANRWYNFWSAVAVEKIFTQIEGVTPAVNNKDRLVDFNLNGINFDHKTSVFPKGFKQTIYYTQNHKEELLYWLYKNQSQQQRKHLENRLFLMVYAEDGAHWKLKAEITWLQSIIQKYVSTFDASLLTPLQWKEKSALSDIIWAVK